MYILMQGQNVTFLPDYFCLHEEMNKPDCNEPAQDCSSNDVPGVRTVRDGSNLCSQNEIIPIWP
jgi:hypothetical protein